MQGWKEKLLSQAGKEVMIKAVIQSIPVYSMNAFKLPVSLCKDIEAMIRKFWWGSGKGKKIHWVKWSALCSSKSIGGMGFQDINNFNDAMLAKQFEGSFIKKNTLLYKVFSAKYFPGGNILDAPIPTKCSYTWKSILLSRKNLFYLWEAKVIRKIYVSEASDTDCLVWLKSSDGCYSIKSAYQMLATEVNNKAPSSSGGEGTKVWKSIWKIRVPPKIRHFMWRTAKDSLPTK
ncbi:hypothetical protein SO802_000441 [Lithocarpus litseifolius]|uniref:Reverse transcriptase zinc-binding domain-containing protein n=1 Tax=Lithocarpus litseifolius TaxID=425828 RepID=A0AAW2DRK9_9ROSI